MDSRIDRREAAKDYKARKPSRGVFAVRSQATGQVWVGSSTHLDTARNGIWFGLRGGSHHNQTLQAAWNAELAPGSGESHAEPDFTYEILEQLDEDVQPLAINDLLKAMKSRWQTQLNALSLL